MNIFTPITDQEARKLQRAAYNSKDSKYKAKYTFKQYLKNLEDSPLAGYTLAAAVDLTRAHGLDLEEEIARYLGGK